jgi:hypothetical protein
MYLWIIGDDFERWQSDGVNRGKITLDLTPSLQADEDLNDSDKTLTVPADTEWIVKWIWVEFTSGAGANRQMEIQIQDDAADVIAEIKAGVAQGAAITRYYLFGPHCADLAAFRDTDYLMTPMPEWILPAGYHVRIWDNAAVLPAADDMIIQMMVLSRTV